MRIARMVVLAWAPAAMFAAGCEESFRKSGSALTGSKYNASVWVEALTVADAIEQLRGAAIERKLDVLTADAANGNMLLEQRESMRNKSIPFVISVTADGGGARIQMLVKLNKGAFAKAEDVRAEMCAILTQVKGGEEGRAAAAQGAAAVASTEPRKVEALVLSLELARQTQESAASIPLRYRGRVFTVSGRVKYVMKDGDVYRVAFDIPEPRDMVIKPGSRDPQFKIDISCLMAPSQTAWSIALREGEKVRLTGSYSDFDPFRRVMWLGGCTAE